MGTAKFTARRHSVRIPSAVPQAYAACAHLSLLLLPRRVSASRVLVSLKMIRFLLVHALLESTYATCEPNRDKCDSSIGGDCCTARATDHEERRCRDGWIPIYIGRSCWGDGNEFTCYSPTCSAIPADNCGPNDCYTDADLFFIFIVVPLAVVLIGTLGGVYGCYKGKCCCFTGRHEPPRPTPQPGLALPGAALPVIPLAQPIMAQQAQVVAKAV